MSSFRMVSATTESQLASWRGGQTAGERLAAELLALAGFVDIDPQAPLGGPDGGRDILCRKANVAYVGAVYFPSQTKSPGAIRKKFVLDLEGVSRHRRDGFVFVTNQALTAVQRDDLSAIAQSRGLAVEIFHRESIRLQLDSPRGYGTRLVYLHIPMSAEEQFAYFAESRDAVETALNKHTIELRQLSIRIEQVLAGQDFAGRTIAMIADRLGEPLGVSAARPDVAFGTLVGSPELGILSSRLDIPTILAIHRFVSGDLPAEIVGRLRDVDAVIGLPEGPVGSTLPTPSPGAIIDLLSELLEAWNRSFQELASARSEERLRSIATFHAVLLSIHPFLDGNGRAARALLYQQLIDLFGSVDVSLFDHGVRYYRALRKADQGDPSALAGLLARSIVPPEVRQT
jgi:fido (protein-threonine AMPylation protein)